MTRDWPLLTVVRSVEVILVVVRVEIFLGASSVE
jgi:hypothetical protein